MHCDFCELPEIKQRIIIKNETAFAFPTNIPIVPGHLLFCPNRCAATFDELRKEEAESIFSLIRILKKALKELFGADGFNIAWNEGAAAGQSVPHFHIHLLPRKKGDSGITKYEPRKFLYRPGSREVTPENELQDVAELIRENLKEE